jgi:hypothetical protein
VYSSSLDAVSKILKYEGIRGFYRGLVPSLFFSGPAQTLYLTTYEAAKVKLCELTHFSQETAFVHITSGFIAEAISCIVWVPHDVIKERLQIQRDNTINVKALLSMIRRDGIKNLYKGYWITLGTFGPYSAIYFFGYEKMKNLLTKQHNEKKELSFSATMLAASVSSGVSALFTTPLDVIKTRFQVQRRIELMRQQQIAAGVPISPYTTDQYTNVVDALKKIIKNEGPSALWKGITTRILYNAPNAAVIMSLCKGININFLIL